MSRRRQVLVSLGALLALASARAGPARAHAFLDHADPAVGSTVGSSPAAVTLKFTEPIEPAFSHVDVRNAHGDPVAAGPLEHPAADTLSVHLPALSPGDYTVSWAVVSVDTHATKGTFSFSIKGP